MLQNVTDPPRGLDVARPMTLRRALLYGLQVGMWVAGPVMVFIQFHMYAKVGWLGVDCHAYWLTAHTDTLYSAPALTRDAYLYSPVFAQVIRPLAELPFPWFCGIFIAIDVACFAWLLKPLGWLWTIPILMMMAHEFVLGQVIGMITVCAVLGVTGRGGYWAFGWLTKITPGVFGLAWLASRGDWGQVARALGVSAAITLVSFALWPSAWIDWIEFLHRTSGHPAHQSGFLVSVPLMWRIIAAIVLVVIGARRSWWWAVPVALLIGVPVIGPHTLSYLAGLVRLRPSVRTATAEPSVALAAL